MGLFGLFVGTADCGDTGKGFVPEKGIIPPVDGPIKLRIKGQPSKPSKPALSEVPNFMCSSEPRFGSLPSLPVSTIADSAVAILDTPGIPLRDLLVRDVVVFENGIRHEVLDIAENGAVTVKTTQRFSAEELAGKFHPNTNYLCSLEDYECAIPGEIFYQKDESSESDGTVFTVEQVEKHGGIVQGVIFSFSQVFPQRFDADVGNIVEIIRD